MVTVFKKLLRILSPKERRRLLILVFAIIAMAFFEVIGIGIIGPFLQVVTNPDSIGDSTLLSTLYSLAPVDDINQFIGFLGIAVIVLTVIRNVVALLVKYAEVRFGHMRTYSISMRLLAEYLRQPYVFFLNQNSSRLSQNLLSEVQVVTKGFFIPLIEIIARSVVALSIVGYLIFLSPGVAVLSLMVLGLVYALLYAGIRNFLNRMGKVRLQSNQTKYQIISEVLGGIKDVKLSGTEEVFLRAFKRPAQLMSGAMANSEAAGSLPKFILEILAFSTVMGVVSILALRGDFDRAVPLIGVYAMAGYRLMPIMERIFKFSARLRANQASVDRIYDELFGEHILIPDESYKGLKSSDAHGAIQPVENIAIKGLEFHYPGADSNVVKIDEFIIPANTTVGFVGATGCGKTTTIDLILGLLEPQVGSISVDGTVISDVNRRQWQRSIGYVPQHIYLSDDTISQNIAFGVEKSEIRMDRVRAAAAAANILSFIEDELPNGFDTIVGERGVRLSGGQLQRIGIARALYTDPPVIVLDEATSALDSLTESEIMQAIQYLNHTKTILIIAHRISTLRNADVIAVMAGGTIQESGTYDELVEKNSYFKKLAHK